MKKIVSLLLGISLLLMGCSITSDQTVSNSETVTYKSTKGDVQIPKKPQRIVSDYYVGELLKLNANLVGSDLTYESDAWKDEAKKAGVKDTGQSMEKVSSLNPDLIITINEDKYDQYSKIAPTVYIPYEQYQPKELMTELGKITNTENEAKKWNEEFDSEIEDLQKEVEDSDLQNKTFSLIEKNGDNIYTYGDNWARGGYILYDQLNLKATKTAEDTLIGNKVGYLSLNKESVPEYAGDVIFYVDKSQDKANMSDYKSLPKANISDKSVYKDLPAVKNNQVYLIPSYVFHYNDPYSLDEQIQYFMDFFANEKSN